MRTRRRRSATSRRRCPPIARRSPTFRSRASATGRSTGARSRAPTRRTRCRRPIRTRRCARSSRPGVDLTGELLALLATPTIADKTWISRQYDHQLFLNTVNGPGSNAAVLRVRGHEQGAGARDRRQGAVLSPRSSRRRAVGGARSGAQRRVRRRAAARARQLPELRQSRASGSHVAVRRSRRGHERSVRGARPSGHRRQRQLLQRVERRRHPPDAGGRRARADRRARRALRRGPRCTPATK